MSYAIMRIAKLKASNVGGADKHNERKNENYSNKDINKDLTYLNYNLIECESYKNAINNEIKERYTSSRSIRKDAVVGVEVIFTSDNEFFKNLTEEQERLYFEKSLEFLKDFVGEKNVISATVHKDEKTPHMHCVFTPITEDGRLHFKSFINGRTELSQFQDKYYNYISKDFDLERGKSVEETQRKHLSVTEYKLETAINERELELEKVQENTEEIKTKNEDLENQKANINNEQENINKILEDLKEFENKLKKKKEELDKREKASLELEKKLTLKNERLYHLEQIMNSAEKKKNFFSKNDEAKIIISERAYKALICFSRDGEKFLIERDNAEREKDIIKQNFNVVKKDLSNLTKDYTQLKKDYSIIKTKKTNLFLELNSVNTSLENLKEKSKEQASYITKLEKALPEEKLEKIKQELQEKENPWEKHLRQTRSRDNEMER